MESTDKEAIQAKIDKWKDVEDASNKFMQRLDDLYSGKTEKQNEQDSEDVKPEVYEQTPEPVPPTIEDEVKEPTDISDKRRQVVQNREQYFTQERDSRGNNKFVLNPDNTFGDAYKNANMKLQQSYKLLFPNTKTILIMLHNLGQHLLIVIVKQLMLGKRCIIFVINQKKKQEKMEQHLKQKNQSKR